MTLSLPRPLAVLAGIAVASGVVISLRTAPPRPEMSVWTFDAAPLELWKRQAGGDDVSFELMGPRALNVRLQSILNQPHSTTPPPDVVAIEIGSAGRYLRGDAEHVPLLPLDELLAGSPLRDRFLPSRLELWRHDGVLFGLPLDTHPVVFAFRRDLFTAAGLDLDTARTWPELRDLLRRYTHSQRRPAIELPRNSSDVVMQMLLQQHLELFDSAGNVDWSDPRFARTIAFYATLVAGRDRVAIEPATAAALTGRDLETGAIACLLTADWRLQSLRNVSAPLSLRPLPIFTEGDAPVSTWGGTMLAIPRTARDPNASWRLIEQVMLSTPTLADWPKATGTLPGTNSIELVGDDKALKLFADLAPLTPRRRLTPFTTAALAQLSIVVSRAADSMDARGEAGLEDFVRRELDMQAADLQRRMAQFDTRSRE